MRRTIVFGASGFIGRHLLQQADRNHVSPVARRPQQQAEGGRGAFDWVEADLLNPESIAAVLSPGSTVINLAYSAAAAEANITMAANLGRACAQRQVAKLVHCSTAVVVGSNPAPIVVEETACSPTTPYERTKHEIERVLSDTARERIPLYVLRPTAVVGPGGQNLRKLLDEIRYGSATSNFVRSSVYGARRMNLVPVEDVVAALMFLSKETSVPPGVFICAADEDPDNRYDRIERIMRDTLNRPPPLPPVRLPMPVLNSLLRLTRSGSARLANRSYSSDKLKRSGFLRVGSVSASVRGFVSAAAAASRPA